MGNFREISTKLDSNTPENISGRYRVERLIGKGGMARVYEVVDVFTKEKLALKHLVNTGDAGRNEKHIRLFEREFRTLAQFAHPRVVTVHNFGVEDGLPYYTMELLTGGDLREMSPLPWKSACSILSDLCSVLSFLHSRRQLHNDISPRNIRCTENGKAKLVDFGATAPMGPCHCIIGTPPFTPPEVVNMLTTDARADLYSLGACAYFALTGRHAFPARNFRQLRDMWRNQPIPPTNFVEEIPKDLEQLVLALMNLNPVGRPVSAAEIYERLTAIASLKIEKQLVVAKTQLANPILVGRKQSIGEVRRHMIRGLKKKGSSLLVKGVSGIGRSRFLDACVLEAKLAGATVLRIHAEDSKKQPWGAARALILRALDAMPQNAIRIIEPFVQILGHIVSDIDIQLSDARFNLLAPPKEDEWKVQRAISSPPPPLRVEQRQEEETSTLGQSIGAKSIASVPTSPSQRSSSQPSIPLKVLKSPEELRSALQEALGEMLIYLCQRRYLVLAIDDWQSIDEPTQALLAILSRQISHSRMVIVTTCETAAASNQTEIQRILEQSSTLLELEPLSRSDLEILLDSVFGKTPNAQLLTDKLYKLSRGNPRAVMQIAQYMLDKGIIRFESGVFFIPSEIDNAEMPGSISEALKDSVSDLDSEAKKLSQIVSLSPESGYAFEDFLLLSGYPDKAGLHKTLDELMARGIFFYNGDQYSFVHQGWVSTFQKTLDEKTAREHHSKLALLFESRDEKFSAVRHLLFAGKNEQALDVFLAYEEQIREQFQKDPDAFFAFLHALPKDWLEVYERMIHLAQDSGRSAREVFNLRRGLVNLGKGTTGIFHLHNLIEQLVELSGLKVYERLDATMEPDSRLFEALKIAGERYDLAPESEQIMPPGEAIEELVHLAVFANLIQSTIFDNSVVKPLKTLAPFAVLSPSIEQVDRLLQATACLLAGRYNRAIEIYRKILKRLDEPDLAGLNRLQHKQMRLGVIYGIALTEASLGLPTGLELLKEIEFEPLVRINVWSVRMVHYLRQGDTARATTCRDRVELLLIQNSPDQLFGGSHVYTELLAYAVADDLTGVGQTIGRIRSIADRFEKWKPILYLAEGHQNRIRGNLKDALDDFERALGYSKEELHIAWAHASGGYLSVLYELERFDDVCRKGDELLAIALREEIKQNRPYITMPLALAEARRGNHKRAVELADSVVDDWKNRGITGLTMGLAYENRARVALLMGDTQSFRDNAIRTAAEYKIGRNPTLTAKYERLILDARQASIGVTDDLSRAAEYNSSLRTNSQELVAQTISRGINKTERLDLALDLLVRQSNSKGGFFYTHSDQGLSLSAKHCAKDVPEVIDLKSRRFFEQEIGSEAEEISTQTDSKNDTEKWQGPSGEEYRPLLLIHMTEKGFAASGLVVLEVNPNATFHNPTEIATAISHLMGKELKTVTLT